MGRVRVGVIGNGQIGMAHLQQYAKLPEVEVVAVSDLSAEKVEAARKLSGAPHSYTDFRELLKREDIQAVDVCVHNNKHAPITIAALQAGKHVYCEKPMAGSYRDAERMVRAAAKYERRLHIQMGTLYETHTHAAKQLIDDGHLGRIYHVRSFGYRRRGRPFVDGYGTANFVDKSICAGGALFDMGIYHIGQILHLIGNPVVQTVSGNTHQALDMYEDRRAFSQYGVEEIALGFVRLEGGITFDIEETWAVHHDGSEASKVLGSKGGLRLDPLAYFSSISDISASTTFDLKALDARWRECRPKYRWYEHSSTHWAGALLGEVPLLPTAQYALNAALISEGIYQSSASGREWTAAEIRDHSVSSAIDPFIPEKIWK